MTKNKILILILLLSVASLHVGQVPNLMSFQGVVIAADSSIVALQDVGIRISFLQATSEGRVAYSETHTATTNANGLFSIVIGAGQATGSGELSSIDWADGPYFMKCEIDPTGGSDYSIESTTQLLSVPYALHASTTSHLIGLSDTLNALRDYYNNQMIDIQHHFDSTIAALLDIADTTRPVPTDSSHSPTLTSHFSVGTHSHVDFAPGNLQYQASTDTWRFAPHQYDYAGENNTHLSSSYEGWIDLFGWGTSGWPSGAIVYKPYGTSTLAADYAVGGDATHNLTGTTARADWGVYNAIANDAAGTWRTLSQSEWDYLINQRTASTIGGVANARFVRATVDGIKGLILFPDRYNFPIGVTLPVDSLINRSDADGYATTYTVHEWTAIEDAGAVFLPAGGYRGGTTLLTNPPTGYYWSTTRFSAERAYAMMFNPTSVQPAHHFMRSWGCFVRLVKDVEE